MHTIATRLVLISLALVLGIQAEAQSPRLTGARAPAQVVFVCEHGSVADCPRSRDAIVTQIDALVDELTHSGLP